jgi:hypothetical protein
MERNIGEIHRGEIKRRDRRGKKKGEKRREKNKGEKEGICRQWGEA